VGLGLTVICVSWLPMLLASKTKKNDSNPASTIETSPANQADQATK
jgi:hypothetical protein